MSQQPRARRLKFATDLFERFTRSTHFHPDFTFSRTSRYVNWKLVLWLFGSIVVLYYVLVAVADIGIYRKSADTGFTRFMESVFPYPAGVAQKQVILLSRYRKEVAARVTYGERHQLTATKSEISALVINQLIDKSLYSQAASRYNILVGTKDVDSSLQDIYAQIGGQDKLDAFIHDNYGSDVTMSDFRLWIQESLIQSALQHQVLEHAEVSHILITGDKQKALDVKAKITDPTQFADIAKQYSEDISSRDKGGALGTTVRGDDEPVISADFENAVFSMPIGQVSDPIQSKYGWHLVLVTSRGGTVKQSMKQFTQSLRDQYKPRAFIGS